MANNIAEQLKQVVQSNLNRSSKKIALSLDVGTSHIKAIALEREPSVVTITGFQCEKIEGDAKEAVRKVLSRLPSGRKTIGVCVAGHGTVLRYIQLPIMSLEETHKAMSFELDRYIPFGKNEVNFDFAILKKNKNTGKMLVAIAAAKKELIENAVALCREVGYTATFVDLCPLAVANYCEFTQGAKEGVYGVINLGATITSLDIIEDGVLVLSRDIFIGGNDFTKKISETTSKSIQEAEKAKLTAADGNEHIAALEQLLTNLTGQIKVSFDFYESQANRPIEKIFITGGSAQLKGLAEFFKNVLEQEVVIMTADAAKIKLAPTVKADDFKQRFPFFTVALGMALR